MSRDDALRWPAPRDGQRRLTLLGSHHLANPGEDAHNLAVDDTLAPNRQRELAGLCELLEPGAFDRVAVEVPRERQTALDGQYRAFRTDAALDDESRFPDGPAAVRSEVAQVGFRVADALDRERVHAVDSVPEPPGIDANWTIETDPDAVSYRVPDFEEMLDAERRSVRESTLSEVYRNQNRGERLRRFHAGNAAASFSSSDGDHVGSRQFGHWYERNGRMLENLLRATGPDEETLFVVGAGHVLPVKQLAEAHPAACPRSPLPLLTE